MSKKHLNKITYNGIEFRLGDVFWFEKGFWEKEKGHHGELMKIKHSNLLDRNDNGSFLLYFRLFKKEAELNNFFLFHFCRWIEQGKIKPLRKQ